jgi:hypothetical protein
MVTVSECHQGNAVGNDMLRGGGSEQSVIAQDDFQREVKGEAWELKGEACRLAG